MKLSVVTTTPEVQAAVPVALLNGSFAERLDRAARLGYDGVELMTLRPAELDGDDIAAQVSYCGMEIAAVASGAIPFLDRLTLLAGDPAARAAAEERLCQLIDFAATVRAPLVTIGGFRGRLANMQGTNSEDARGYLIEVLRRAAERAGSCGIWLALEPLNRYETDIVNTAAEGLQLIGEVGHGHLGLLLDTFHMNIEEPTYAGSIEQAMAAGRLWHLHLGDSNRLPPGRGHIPFGDIVAVLRRTAYHGYLSAELFARPDPDSAAAATATYMRAVLRQ
jgi:5-keto-L-gluconate epimerase